MSGTRPPLLALGALTALGSLATHLFVPALPAAAADLGVTPAAAQQAISVYVLGLGLSQPVWGPVSDRFDRRRVLAASVLLFLVGSVAAAAASGLELLLGARLLQGAGGAGALISCRAIVTAASAPGGAARSLAALTAITLVSPALAPLAGSLIAASAGWRAPFAILALLAAAGLGFVLRLPALPAGSEARTVAQVARGYRRLLGDPRFRVLVAANGLIVAAFYIFLAASPFILRRDFALSAPALGACYTAVASAMIAGTLATGRLHRTGSVVLERIGLASIMVGSLALAIEGATALAGPIGLVLPMMLVGFGSGIVAPVVLAAAIASEAGFAGSAASIFGAVQMLATAALSSLATLLLGVSDLVLVALAAMAAAGAAMLAPLLARRPSGSAANQ